MLKFVLGVNYHLKVRAGLTTTLTATRGKVAFYAGESQVGECISALEFSAQAGASAFAEISRTLRACESEAVLRVDSVQ